MTAATDSAVRGVEKAVTASESRINTARDVALARMEEVTATLSPI